MTAKNKNYLPLSDWDISTFIYILQDFCFCFNLAAGTQDVSALGGLDPAKLAPDPPGIAPHKDDIQIPLSFLGDLGQSPAPYKHRFMSRII